jgi:hypothetical protein
MFRRWRNSGASSNPERFQENRIPLFRPALYSGRAGFAKNRIPLFRPAL